MVKIIFTSILIAFPFGQLLKWSFVNVFDVLVLIIAIWTFLRKPKYPKWYPYFLTFVLFSLFSWIFNYFVFNNILAIKGLLYLLRLLSYSYVAVYVYNFSKNYDNLLKSLTLIAVISAIFGWLQYLFLPDTRFLKDYGWDDHLYRMIGTFFDPAFLGIILVLGSTITLYRKKYFTFVFLALSIIFTYSRASYLALFLVYLFDFVKNKNIFKFIALNLIFIVLVFVPKNLSEGTNFSRTVSTYNKISNFSQTFEIIKKSPVLGVGYNNLCLIKDRTQLKSHSCFGADNSILFILATTGVIGLVLFISFVLKVFELSNKSYMLLATFCAILLHSMFTNTLFYPHVMFWMFILLGSKVDVKSR